MIRVKDVLDWLNYADHSHLTRPLRPDTSKFLNLHKNRTVEDGEITSAISTSLKSTDIHEYPEVLVRSGVAMINRQQYKDAINYFREAIIKYTDFGDLHRKAVTLWLMGIAGWHASDNFLAVENWRESRKNFQDLYHEYDVELQFFAEDPEKIQEQKILEQKMDWYKLRISEMDFDLSSTMEEAYTWLNIFKNQYSHLSPPIQQSKDVIVYNLKKKNYSAVKQKLIEMRQLGENSLDFVEKAEVFCFCGLINCQMNDLIESTKLLSISSGTFLPESHKQGVSCWMCGIALWQIPDETVQAILNLQKCITIFSELAIKADHEDDQDAHRWYMDKQELLSGILRQRHMKLTG